MTKTLCLPRVWVRNVTPRLHGINLRGELVGLENIELISNRPLEVWLDEIKQLKDRFPDRVLIASIMSDATSAGDWQELAKRCQEVGADVLELNLSCPHGMPERGMGSAIGQDPELTGRVTTWVKEVAKVPVMVKLSPNVTDITEPARAAQAHGADALSAINTVSALVGIDLETLRPLPSVDGRSTFGGYSGPAIKPIALRCVAELAQTISLPISASGGISTWQDAAEFLLVGAFTFQICTRVMQHGYGIIDDLQKGLEGFLKRHGFGSLAEAVGKALPELTAHGELNRSYRVVGHIDRSLCTGCQRCYISCRDAGYQAIGLDREGLAVVDEEKCDGCGLCQQVCPAEGCVSMKRVG